MQGATQLDEDDKYFAFDLFSIRNGGDQCFQHKRLSPNLLIRVVRCPFVSPSLVKARLQCIQNDFLRFHARDEGSYHFDLSEVVTPTQRSGCTIYLVLNYISNNRKRTKILNVPAHTNLLQALTYDEVVSDSIQDAVDGSPNTEVFNQGNYILTLENIFCQAYNKSVNQEPQNEATTHIRFAPPKPNPYAIDSLSDTSPNSSPSSSPSSSGSENEFSGSKELSPLSQHCPRSPNQHHQKHQKHQQHQQHQQPNVLKFQVMEVDTDEVLGRGSYGVVVSGWIKISQRQPERVAVKCLSTGKNGALNHQNALELNKEIKLMSTFKHEHIVQYFGSKTHNNVLYIYCEFMSGGSLDKLIKTAAKQGTGALPLDTVQCYGYQILSGLVYLHGNHVAHLDLKPGNILIGKNGIVKLADFDKSKRFNEGTTMINGKNMTDSCVGTCLFCAPEVLSWKSQQISRKSDGKRVHSVFVVVVLLLQIQRPGYSHSFCIVCVLFKSGHMAVR